LTTALAREFLHAHPTPEALTALTTRQWQRWARGRRLSEARIGDLWKVLQQPQLPVPAHVVRAKARLMQSLVEQLTPVVAAVAQYRKAIDDFFARMPAARWARTLPISLGGERRGAEAASDHFNEPSALHHWVFPQVVCESGARGCGAWGNRAGSMQEPTSLAGRESSRARASPTSLRRGVPTTPNMTKSGRRQESECSRTCLAGRPDRATLNQFLGEVWVNERG